MTLRWVWASVLAALLGACAADKPKPTELETYDAKIAGRLVWEGRIAQIGFALVPAVKDGVFYLASGDGEVRALQSETGALLWSAQVGGALSAF